MKKVLLTGLMVALVSTGSIFAQAQKIGHINMQELVTAMPESDSAQVKLKKAANELDNTYQQLQDEFKKKYDDYNKNASTFSDLVRNTKETELQDMSQRMQTFQQNAQQDLQTQQQKLMKPILDKANKAISDVARENKFTYVLDSTQGIILYMGTDAIDLMPLVKKKLGLKE